MNTSPLSSHCCCLLKLIKHFNTFASLSHVGLRTTVRRQFVTTVLSAKGKFPLCRNRIFLRNLSQKHSGSNRDVFETSKRSILLYASGVVILVAGLSYAAVPLYRLYCQATGYGGEVSKGHDSSKVEAMSRVPHRLIKVRFNADVSSTMTWKFVPQQTDVHVAPGETALAFYTATNPLDRAVIGIATYNVVPFEAGQYFNKIQCFCFEEQRLNAHEQVDMPVFFYIDPEFAEDPKLENVDTITLSYTFFEAKDNVTIPVPSYARH